MSLPMSDDEIRVSFNTAKFKQKQIQVLAELNAVPQRAMVEKLRELGCVVPKFQVPKQQPLRAHDVLFDVDRARALFAEGRSDLDCAEMLGVSVYAFATWRRKNGLNRPKGGAAQHKTSPAPKPKPCRAQPPTPPEVETPEPEPAPETAVPGSQAPLSAPDKQTSAAALGRVLLDLSERYPGLMLTVNGAGVRSVCLNVRVIMGEDTTTSTLDLEVG